MIFGPTVDLEDEVHRNADAEKLYGWLVEKGGWQSRSKISIDCFKRHLPKSGLDAALERLALEGRIERRDVDGGGPTRRTEYRAIRTPHPIRPDFAQPSHKVSRPARRVSIKASQVSQSSHLK
jgi:hypothetical protein